MDTIWHTLQANAPQAAFAALFLLVGLYGLRPRDWSRRKRKLLNELNMSPAEVEILFRPTRDVVYNGMQRTGSAAVAIGGGIAFCLLLFVSPAAASTGLFACAALLLIAGGAIFAFKLQTMRDIAELYKIDKLRSGMTGGVGPAAKRPLVSGYARYRGIVLLVMGLWIGYSLLRQFVPALPDLKWPG